MSSYFRDHTNHLIRFEPLRNLLIEYLTPSPIHSCPVDLPQFSLVDIQPTPMEQHEQDTPRHVPVNAHNGQHELWGHVYMNPIRQTPISAIVLPAHHTTLNLKPGMLQALPQFHSYEVERPYMHLKNFEDACSIFQDNSCPRKVLLLKLFPFTLKDKAKLWFNSLRPRLFIYGIHWKGNSRKSSFLRIVRRHYDVSYLNLHQIVARVSSKLGRDLRTY